MPRAWDSGVTEEALEQRAQILARIRSFFAERGVLEVTTPSVAPFGVTDLHLSNLTTELSADASGRRGYLQTSPEYAMKRLLAETGRAIYQICPAYRGGESGGRHHPEFTILEWYRPGFGLDDLITEVGHLLRPWQPDAGDLKVCSYRSLFEGATGINPHVATVDALMGVAEAHSIPVDHIDRADDQGQRADCLDVLFSALVEPSLTGHVVTGYPGCQAALARTATDTKGETVSVRFEVFVDGMELANGYDELRDAGELRRRFEENNRLRIRRGLAPVDLDERLLSALPSLPRCSGVAVGIDRLHMLAFGHQHIGEVTPFVNDWA